MSQDKRARAAERAARASGDVKQAVAAAASASRGRLAILALDLGTNTGWATWDGAGRATSGSQRFELAKGESPGMRFLRFRKWLNEVVGLSGARLIARERMLPVAMPGAAQALAGGLHALVEEIAAERGLESATIAPATLKKHATGRGNAAKPEMIEAAQRRWPALQLAAVGHDEADALLVLAWALEQAGFSLPPTQDLFA